MNVAGPITGPGAIFSEGVPDEIEPSHVVIGSENYYITMGHNTAKYTVIIGIIMIVLLVILLFGFIFYFSATQTIPVIITPELPNTPTTILITQGRGRSQIIPFAGPNDGNLLNIPIMCSNKLISNWNAGIGFCNCVPPYWSGNCLRESYKPQYIPLGNLDPNNVTFEPIGDPFETTRLSYSDNTLASCTDTCDNTTNCVGVYWKRNKTVGGECTLFSSINPNNNFHFKIDPNVDSNFYVNHNLQAFDFTDRVIIFTGSAPNWWRDIKAGTSLTTSGDRVLVAMQNTQYQLDFYPENVYNTTTMTGVYALFPFTLTDFDNLVTGGDTDTVYINPPAAQLTVPVTWYGLPIWVMYSVAT